MAKAADLTAVVRSLRELPFVLPKKWLGKRIGGDEIRTADQETESEKMWDKLVLGAQDNAHYMQSSAWGRSKTQSQWPVSRYIAYAEDQLLPIQVFSRTAPGVGRIHYAPEVSGVTSHNVSYITSQLRDQYGQGFVFKMELYQEYSQELVDAFIGAGWVVGNSVQHRHSVCVDLSGTEDELFARMKKRARYETRVAQRNNVRIEKVDVTPEKLDVLASLMNITAKRSGAFFRKTNYTSKYWKSFAASKQASLYFAYHEHDLLAGAFVITFGKTAWYKDGGSVRHKSSLMGPRLLQWEIMRDLQSQGVEMYDLSGIPSADELETSTMKGLHTFKTGFTKNTVSYMPAMELPFSKRYGLWPKSEHQFLRLYAGFTRDFWY